MTAPDAAPVALITGSAVRIGRQIALTLAEAGWDIAVHYNRSAGDAETTVADIRALGRRAEAFSASLDDHAAMVALIPRVKEVLGTVGVLINNASVFENDRVTDATPESWNRHMDANLKAPFFLSQHFAAQLPEDVQGNIINILDQRVWNLTPYFASYTVSKTGLWTLTQTMAMEFGPRIRVNAIGPGPVLANTRQSAAQFQKQWESTLLKRGAEPTEIAEGVKYILSAKSLTGQMIALDGGQHLPWPPLSPAGAALD